MNLISKILILMVLFAFVSENAYSAMRMKLPRAPKQSYTRQVGGNIKQKSKVEYDRGGKRYTKNVNPGQTHFIPKDAKNIHINGMRIRQGERVTVSPRGASLFDD